MTLLPLLLPIAVAGTPASFYPNAGSDLVTIDADGTLGGVPVSRTGALLVRAQDPGALAHVPGVAKISALRGDGRTVRIVVEVGVDEVALSRRLHDRSDVDWAHPDLAYRLVPMSTPDDPFFDDQWHLYNSGSGGGSPNVDINAIPAWTVTTGEGGRVAVLDSGVDLAHPDLIVTSGWDYLDDDDDSSPIDNGHGTSAAGLSAAIGDNGLGVSGVAWGADVYAIRLIGGETSLSDVHDAIVEAVEAGAWVVNNSWGYGTDCPDIPGYSSTNSALNIAETEGRDGLGTVVVFSAGNGACDASNNGLLMYSTVVAVAASNRRDRQESYSSFGEMVDITAPSGGVITTDISGPDLGYGSWRGDADYNGSFSGTSASAPIVSGVFTLMLAANPHLLASEARAAMCETAARIDPESAGYDEAGWSPKYGCGRADAGAAVNAVANGLPELPVVLAPGSSAPADRVVLRWDSADPDDDPVNWEVSWRFQDGDWQTVLVDEPWLDLTGVAEVGDGMRWKVLAVDAWGAGPETERQDFDVVEAAVEPEAPVVEEKKEPEGCHAVPNRSGLPLGGAAGLLASMVLVGARRRGLS
jgi:subtilisin family serine protease